LWRCSRRQTKSKDDETKANELSLVEWSSAAVDGRGAAYNPPKEQNKPPIHSSIPVNLSLPLLNFIGLFSSV